MSYMSWHYYGYGIKVSEISEPSEEQIKNLLALAPELNKRMKATLDKFSVKNPTVKDYLEAECLAYESLAGLLSEVILEAEGIDLLGCEDYEETQYLIYSQKYPWCMNEKDRTMTESELDAIFAKYIAIISDDEVTADYQSVENGG